MRNLLDWSLVAAFLLLGAVNLQYNPFLPVVACADEGCEGPPPGENCHCCSCGCWICDD